MESQKSYYYDTDPSCSIIRRTLADIYATQASQESAKGVTWCRPALRMTYTEIYEEVSLQNDLHICISNAHLLGQILFHF